MNAWRFFGHTAGAALVLAMAAGLAGAGDRPDRAVPLLDLKESVQKVTIENFQLELQCEGVMPNDTALVCSLTRADGRWYSPARARAARYNTASHVADPNALKLEGDRIHGEMPVLVVPDRWVPKDGKERTLTVKVDVRIDRGSEPWKAKGTCSSQFEGKRRDGKATGALGLAQRDSHWDAGTWDDGLALRMDMGTKRVNWNHARHAVCTFEPPRDLSGYEGLRIRVETDKPRRDAEVSVWLAEADGSWYYLRSAIPLADRKNEGICLFEDFAVAEWVSPGNHQDEDFLLDLSSIGKLAIGVVNPMGVGEVSFKVTGIDLVGPDAAGPDPAAVTVSGLTLSINGHDKVPAGVFGGYAAYLPQEYRPGCQRNLEAPAYPNVPRQRFVEFGPESFTDWPAMVRALRGESKAHKAVAAHLLGLIADEKLRTGLEKLNIDATVEALRKRDRDPNAAPQQLTRPLNELLRRSDLHAKDAWPGVKLAKTERAGLGRLAKGLLNDTERMELNRRLLETAFGKLIKPVGRGGPSEMFYIDCFGERKNTAILLTRADWKEMFTDYGRQLALNARKTGCPVHWEFWNEPYLHWGEKDRVNLQSRYYREDLAKEGGPVRVKRPGDPNPPRTQPGGVSADANSGEVIPHFKWVSDGKGGLKVVDETAFTFWSGGGNGWIYDQMLAAAASSIKKHNPDVQVIAGWGFRWNEDHWAAWDVLYRNTIDRNIGWIDGVHEHHYQGDTTAMNGSYEVLAAYSTTKHNKWLYSYNTETNDLIDTPARGAVDTPAKAAASREYRQMVYNLRDVLYCVGQSPDKIRARTMIHCQKVPEATRVCFGLLKDLRGRLIETRSDDPKVWAVASIDGTDPQAQAGDFDGTQRLVVVVYNDHRCPQQVDLTIVAPEGTEFCPGVIEWTTVDRRSFAVDLPSQANVPLGKAGVTLKLGLENQSAWKIVIPLKGKIATRDEVRRKQYFSADILRKVERGRPLKTKVALDAAALRSAQRAWLRLVVEDIAPGEAEVAVGATKQALPRAHTADNVNRIVELPLDPKALKASNEVTFTVRPGNHAGYRVDMTSIVLESRSR